MSDCTSLQQHLPYYRRRYSAAGKFVNPLEFSTFLHKYDPKHHQIFAQVLKVDKENPIKQMDNDPILHICEWQKYVNLLD